MRYVEDNFLLLLVTMALACLPNKTVRGETTEIGNPNSAELVLDPRAFGAVGDGIHDDTSSMQAAIDEGALMRVTIRVQRGTYLIDAKRGLLLPSNTKLEFDAGAQFQVIPNREAGYSLLNIINSKDVQIKGGHLTGDKNSHLNNVGEWGMGISLRGAHNVLLTNVEISDFWGDGIYMSENTTSVKLSAVTSRNNRRQGLSIVSAAHVTIENSIFELTGGTPPAAGIDIEPNTADQVDDITIEKSIIRLNAGHGIVITRPYANEKASVQRVTIRHSVIANNTQGGVAIWNTEGHILENNYFMSNSKPAIFLDKNAHNNLLKENILPLQYGILDKGSSNLKIKNVHFE